MRVRLADLSVRLGRSGLVDGIRRWWRGRGSLAGPRCDPGRGGVLAMAVVAVLVAAGAGCWVLASRPHRVPISAQLTPAATSAAPVRPGGSLMSPVAAPASSSSPAGLLVDVVGKVRRPGLYRLPVGARVDDAVTAAGGVLAGVDPVSVNLASKLTDGEQLVIGLATAPAAGAAAPAASVPDSASGGASTGLLDLNTATAAQLDGLPGVGPVLAQRIVDWRTQHGRFDSIDQLQDVSGIGAAKYGELKSLVTVG